MTKILKNQKNPILEPWGNFGLSGSNFGKNEFFWKKGSVSFKIF